MSEDTGAAFRRALDEHMAARRSAGATAAELAHIRLRDAAGAHAERTRADPGDAPAALAAEYERVCGDPYASQDLVRATEETLAVAVLAAEYERLRDDPAADRAAVLAASEALATARQAHRVHAGKPLTSGAG